MKKLLVCLLTSALLAGTAFTMAEAATQQIQFAKGKTSASVSGTVKGHDDMDYVLRAKAGQTLTVDFKGGKGANYFNVLPPGSSGEAIFVGSSEGDHFKGTLPKDGEYTIRVYLMGAAKTSDKPVNFTLKVGIPATGKTTDSASSKTSETAAAEKACLAATAKTVGIKANKLKITDVSTAESGVLVMIQVPEATAPWKCLSSKKGKVDGVEFTGSEGKL